MVFFEKKQLQIGYRGKCRAAEWEFTPVTARGRGGETLYFPVDSLYHNLYRRCRVSIYVPTVNFNLFKEKINLFLP